MSGASTGTTPSGPGPAVNATTTPQVAFLNRAPHNTGKRHSWSIAQTPTEGTLQQAQSFRSLR